MFSQIKTKINGILFLSIILITACSWSIIPVGAQVQDDSEVTIRLNATIIAEDDQAKTVINTPIIIEVLTNDKFYGSDPVINTLKITRQPEHGSININGDKVEYVPEHDYTGLDTFVYEICNQHDQCDQAEVVVKVEGEKKEKPKEEPKEEPKEDVLIPPENPEEEPRIVISLPRTGGVALGAGLGIGTFITLLIVIIISKLVRKNEEKSEPAVEDEWNKKDE